MGTGRQFQQIYRPGKPPGRISPGHLDRVYITTDFLIYYSCSYYSSMSKVTIKLNRPTYFGMRVLDLIKYIYTNYIVITLKKNSSKSRLLFTDTDLLMYEIKTEDVYEDFSKDKEMFDFNNYSAKSKYYDDSNKLVVCKMKYKKAVLPLKNLLD